jgi:hypothetical protein
MPNPFVDMEEGQGTPGGGIIRDYFGGRTPQPTTPADPRTVSQIRRQRGGPTTARLCRVSTSILAAGGRDDDVVLDGDFGAPPASAPMGGRDAASAPPTSTAPMRKFVREAAVDDGDMLTIDVTLRKEDYGAPGLLDFRMNMLMATTPLTQKFGVARH